MSLSFFVKLKLLFSFIKLYILQVKQFLLNQGAALDRETFNAK